MLEIKNFVISLYKTKFFLKTLFATRPYKKKVFIISYIKKNKLLNLQKL